MICWGGGGLMVSALNFGLSPPGSSPSWGLTYESFVFLGKTLFSDHGVSPYQVNKWVPVN